MDDVHIVATETLYSSEWPDPRFFNSAGLKLDRLARTFRKVLMTNAAANISIVGYLSMKSINEDGVDASLSRMADRIKATRDLLTSFQVWEKSITAYLPLQAAPIIEDFIVVTARDTPTVNPFPGTRVPVGDESIDIDPKKNGAIVVDPFLPPAVPTMQLIIGYMVVPKNWQGVSPIDRNNPLSTLHQFSFTITRPRHFSYTGGWEDSIVVQGTVNINHHGDVDVVDIVNIQGGVQEAYVWVPKVMKGWIQASGLVQLMVSANWSKTASGYTVMAPMVQGAVGAQVLVTPSFSILDAKVQFGVQGMVQGNLPAVVPYAAPYGPGGPSVGYQVGVVVNVVLPPQIAKFFGG